MSSFCTNILYRVPQNIQTNISKAWIPEFRGIELFKRPTFTFATVQDFVYLCKTKNMDDQVGIGRTETDAKDRGVI